MRWRHAGALLAAGFAFVGGCATEAGDVFVWDLTPGRAETTVGGLVPFQIKISTKANINSDVELGQASVPEGFVVTMPAEMASTQETAEGTIYVSPGVEAGTYSIQIQAREAGTDWSLPKTILVIVGGAGSEPDFTVEVDPPSFTMNVETGKTFTYYVRPLNNFAGTVGITLSPLPDDLLLSTPVTPSTLTFQAGGGGQGGTFVLRYTPTPPVPSPVEVIVTVSGNGVTHTRTITLTLPSLAL